MSIAGQRRCENCKRTLVPRTIDQRRVESPKMFKQRRFCSTTCAGIANASKRKMAADEVRA